MERTLGGSRAPLGHWGILAGSKSPAPLFLMVNSSAFVFAHGRNSAACILNEALPFRGQGPVFTTPTCSLRFRRCKEIRKPVNPLAGEESGNKSARELFALRIKKKSQDFKSLSLETQRGTLVCLALLPWIIHSPHPHLEEQAERELGSDASLTLPSHLGASSQPASFSVSEEN